MRGFLVAVVAAAGVLLASFASAQGLGDVAAREKDKRKAEPKSAGKVYTENDLGPSVAPVGVPAALPATAEAEASEEGEEGAETEGGEDAASEDDAREAAEAAWRQKIDQARKEEDVYRDVIDRLQLELNDVTGGVNTPARAAKVAFLEENKQLLAQTQQKIATLEAEGRANGYR